METIDDFEVMATKGRYQIVRISVHGEDVFVIFVGGVPTNRFHTFQEAMAFLAVLGA